MVRHSSTVFQHLLGIVLLMLFAWVITSLQAQRPIAAVHAGGELHVWFLDIGQGDALFIETPDGKQMLIDGGPSSSRMLDKLGALLPPMDRSLDAIVLTHPDADHVSGLVSVLERYDVETIYTTGVGKDSDVFAAFTRDAKQEGAELKHLHAGDVFSFGEAQFVVLWPDHVYHGEIDSDPNDTSIVLRMDYGETSVLFTGDVSFGPEASFGYTAGDVDVLKVGHHGSRSSTSSSLLDLILPEEAVISAGVGNRYGHPTAETLARLQAAGARIWRTDTQGDILLRSTGGEPMMSASPLPY